MPAHAEQEQRVVLDAALAQVAHPERDAARRGAPDDEDQHPRALAEGVDPHRVVEGEPGRVLELASPKPPRPPRAR